MKKILTLLVIILVFSPTFVKSRGTAEEAVELVNKFTNYFYEYGPEKSYDEVQKQNGLFRLKDLYIFVVEVRSEKESIMLAHSVNPIMIGRNVRKLKDFDGKTFFVDFEEIHLSEKGEGWVSYKWPHPDTKKIENKTTFIKRVNKYIYVGCGISK